MKSLSEFQIFEIRWIVSKLILVYNVTVLCLLMRTLYVRQELEEKLEELEVSRDQVAELEELIDELKESTELNQETLQKVYCEEISRRC